MGSSTKKTTSNSTSSATTTPNVPDWAVGPVQNYFGQVGGLISQNWNNPNYLATPANSLQQTAANNAANLPTGASELGQSNAFATQAGNASAGSYKPPTIAPAATAQSASLLDGLDNYFNPYLDKVINTSLADYDVNADRQRGDALAAGARNRGLAGSRFAIGQSALEGELARGRGSLDAGLRSAGFDRATTLSSQDADRRQQTSLFNAGADNTRSLAQAGFDANAGQFNANLGQQQLDRQLAAAGLLSNNAATGSGIANNNVSTQAGVGQSLWDIDRFNNGAELLGLGGIQSLLSGYEPFVGQTINGTESGTQTQKSNGGLLGTLGSALKIGASAASLFSDRRLKTNIERVGEEPDGLGIYEYDYLWEGPRRRGVMADEVAALRPWAMGPEVAGYATVNYGAL